MRLDHLLSKEEEVGVELLLICQGKSKKSLEQTKPKKCEAFFKVALLCKDTILVAMRLGETPVLIPNTMVKT